MGQLNKSGLTCLSLSAGSKEAVKGMGPERGRAQGGEPFKLPFAMPGNEKAQRLGWALELVQVAGAYLRLTAALRNPAAPPKQRIHLLRSGRDSNPHTWQAST